MSRPDPRNLLARSAADKTLAMEGSVARVRAAVVAVNVVTYFLFIGVHRPRVALALTVVMVATVYAIWSLFTRPYERYPLLRFGAATLTMDTLLISFWVLATGGAHSEFWIIYIISVISVAMRYDTAHTLLTAVCEAGLYLVTILLDGGASELGLSVRPAYIIIAGYAAGLLARQERISRQDRVILQQLADRHAEMLVRERATIEELRRIDAVKSEFVANASHELRTPITSLIGYASMIASRHKEMSPENLEESASAIHRQSLRMESLIRNLLDLSQIEYGKAELDLRPVRVADAVERSLEAVAETGAKTIDTLGDQNAGVLADALRFEQILTNLVANAVRYGGDAIHLDIDNQNSIVEIAVRDNGTGVPADLVPHLFSPFARGANARGTTGSGLGLAISYRLAVVLGGSLTYEPTLDPGARFVLRLPSAVVPETYPAAGRASA